MAELQVDNDQDFSPAANTERKSAQSASRTTSKRGMITCCQGAVIGTDIDGGLQSQVVFTNII
jgi:hypothetical protein